MPKRRRTEYYYLSLAIDMELNTMLDDLMNLAGKSKNALIRELLMHAIPSAMEHYRELRILEAKRLEKEKKFPYRKERRKTQDY